MWGHCPGTLPGDTGTLPAAQNPAYPLVFRWLSQTLKPFPPPVARWLWQAVSPAGGPVGVAARIPRCGPGCLSVRVPAGSALALQPVSRAGGSVKPCHRGSPLGLAVPPLLPWGQRGLRPAERARPAASASSLPLAGLRARPCQRCPPACWLPAVI